MTLERMNMNDEPAMRWFKLTALILVALPMFFVLIFHFSERQTREWLGTGFDTDVELLEVPHHGGAVERHRRADAWNHRVETGDLAAVEVHRWPVGRGANRACADQGCQH